MFNPWLPAFATYVDLLCGYALASSKHRSGSDIRTLHRTDVLATKFPLSVAHAVAMCSSVHLSAQPSSHPEYLLKKQASC